MYDNLSIGATLDDSLVIPKRSRNCLPWLGGWYTILSTLNADFKSIEERLNAPLPWPRGQELTQEEYQLLIIRFIIQRIPIANLQDVLRDIVESSDVALLFIMECLKHPHIDFHIPEYPAPRSREYSQDVFKNSKYKLGEFVMAQYTRGPHNLISHDGVIDMKKIEAQKVEPRYSGATIIDRALDIKNENIIVRIRWENCSTFDEEWIVENSARIRVPTREDFKDEYEEEGEGEGDENDSGDNPRHQRSTQQSSLKEQHRSISSFRMAMNRATIWTHLTQYGGWPIDRLLKLHAGMVYRRHMVLPAIMEARPPLVAVLYDIILQYLF